MSLSAQLSIQMVVELVVRLGIGTLLVFSGAIKLLDRHEFRLRWLRAYQIFPEALLPILAVVIPLVELFVGIGFAMGAFGWISVAAVLSILAIVTCGAAVTLLRNKKPACGCFGRLTDHPLSWQLVGRNFFLMGGAGLVAALSGMTPKRGAVLTFAGIALVCAALLLAILIIVGRRPPRNQVREGGGA